MAEKEGLEYPGVADALSPNATSMVNFENGHEIIASIAEQVRNSRIRVPTGQGPGRDDAV